MLPNERTVHVRGATERSGYALAVSGHGRAQRS